MQEEVLFQRDRVKVTNATFAVDGTTYAVRNITAVTAGMSPWKLSYAIVVGLLGLLIAQAEPAFGVIVLIIAAGLVYAGRPRAVLILKTSGGDVQALQSFDDSLVKEAAAALNQAVIRQHN